MELLSKTILLVENEASIGLMEKRWLTNEGFKVIHVTTGEKAIETAISGNEVIDLILMDIDLGAGIDGTEAAREILKTNDIPLLFLSSHTESEIVSRTEEISSYGYVVKGSSNTVLLASIKMVFKLHNANKKNFESRIVTEFYTEGKTETVLPSSRNITEHKEVEKFLKNSNEFLDRIIEMSPHALWISDSEGTLIKSNQALRDLLCVTNEDLVGKYNVFKDNVVEEQGYMPQIKKVFEDGSPVRITLYYEASKLKGIKSGKTEPLYLDLSISAIMDENGKIQHAIIQHIDVTDAKKAEMQLGKYAIELKKLNATKDRLISVLAHDLRGPLTGFAGITDEIVNNLAVMSPDEISLYISTINVTSKKLLELLTNLLEWSRLQTGKMEFSSTEISLHTCVENICKLFSSAAKKKNVAIKNEVSLNRKILADQNMISTVLRNLISNAVKFTGKGGEVIVGFQESDGHAEISVSDNGIGMNKETLGKIFSINSTYSTRGTDNEEGSGYGLALCKEILEKNGGELSARSCPGKGSVFAFRIPQQQ